MTRTPLNLLVDTNVWLDYFLGREGCRDASEALRKAIENEDVIVTTSSVLKDVFYLICTVLKHRAVDSGESAAANAKAINEIGWACISTIQSLSIMVPQGFGEHLQAMLLKDSNKDYEDDLLLATALNAKIDYLITNDRGLLKNDVVPTISPGEYLSNR